ncbi:MAG: ABC transporter permease [Lysobacteraceae bacterium]
MKKTWIFFRLRMLQLKSDKTALFFSYVLPVLLLLGIGLPLQVRDGAVLDVNYRDDAGTTQSKALVEALSKRSYLRLHAYAGDADAARAEVAGNQSKHFLLIAASAGGALDYRLYSNSLADNQVGSAALRGELDALIDGRPAAGLRSQQLSSEKITSYIVILLPGVIGMTLLVIGLNGFGGLLIEEEHQGLFKNIKVIDVSPVPFLSGLFASRMLVAYSVAAVMFAIGVMAFGIPWKIDYALLLIVVTLGALAFHGMGLAFAAISPSVNAFNGIVNFVQIPMIVLGGVFFSIQSFPGWLRTISALTPLAQMNTAMQALLFDGVNMVGIGKVLPQIAGLVAWSLLSLAFARWKFRW